MPGFYEKLATYDTELTRESNHKNLINKILELKKDQEEQKAALESLPLKSLQSFLDTFPDVDNIVLDSLRKQIEEIQSKLQELEEGQEQLQKALEFSIKNNQKQLQEALKASLENLKNEKMGMESCLNMCQDSAKSHKRSIKEFNSIISNPTLYQFTPEYLQAIHKFKIFKYFIYLFMKSKLPELVELFYEINNNNDYSSATYAQKKTELLKSLQDIIQELQRQEVERLQYQCNKQK